MSKDFVQEKLLFGKSAGKKKILPIVTELLGKVFSFSFYRAYLVFRLNHLRKGSNQEKISLYEEKLADYDYIKTNVLTKYFSKELFIYFFICFLFFFVVFFVNQILLLAETILRMRVPVADYLLPTRCYCPVFTICNACGLFDVPWSHGNGQRDSYS